jgi:hypothetical protein
MYSTKPSFRRTYLPIPDSYNWNKYSNPCAYRPPSSILQQHKYSSSTMQSRSGLHLPSGHDQEKRIKYRFIFSKIANTGCFIPLKLHLIYLFDTVNAAENQGTSRVRNLVHGNIISAEMTKKEKKKFGY